MSQSSTTGPRGLSYCPRALCPPTSSFADMHISQPLPTWTLRDSFAEFPTILQRGKALDQHPGLLFLGVPSSVRPSIHVQGHQFDVGLVHADPRIGGGFPNRHKPTNSLVHRVNHALVYPPRRGEPHAFLYRRSTPVTYRPEVPIPADIHAAQTSHQRIFGRHSPTTPSCQPNWQAAALPQRPPPYRQDLSTYPNTTAQSPRPTPLVFVEDPLSITASSKCQGTGAKETMPAMESCPFPTCLKKCGRLQELERHIRKHLPRCIFCRQPGCSWTGTRRYALVDHLKKKHTDVAIPEPERGEFVIYDAKRLIKQLINKEITVEQALCKARSLFRNRALQLGKLGSWRTRE